MSSVMSDEIKYFNQLDERQKRLFAGLKAKAIGVGGVKLVSELFDIHPNTVRKGKVEFAQAPEIPQKRIRQVGAGPKKK